MSYIYYRESTKSFPPLGHSLVPPLFIEAGKMPCSSQDKAKPCIILVNLAGIYFLRPEKLKKAYKISKFLSSFLITEIVYDEKKRTINTKHDSAYIQCPHMDEAIEQLVSSRKFLLQKLYDKSPVKFTNFPTQPIINSNLHVNASLLTLQYICYCIQHDIIPDDNGIIPKFERFDPQHHSIIYFDESCTAPDHLNCLCGPIHFLDSVNTLHFSNFAPYSACRIIHKIMRHQLRIRAFIIDGYQHLVPEQLRLKKFSPKSLISIVIQNCRLSEELMITLFKEFGEFQGEVQRLSLINVELTDKSWKELLNVLTTCRAFRTMEIFELEKIETSQFFEDQLYNDILTICKHCRFIQRFSISLWAQPQLYTSIEPFFINSFLYELILQGQNITQPFPDSLRLPRCCHYLDFSGCNFTYVSLKSLFSFLSKTTDHNPITLNLADIMLPSAQWHQFYQDLSTINQLNYIGELDWSGNGIDPSFIRDTVSFFFLLNPLRFLKIDRVFGNSKIEDFCTFFSAIPHGKLQGLSIGGSPEQNFSGNFAQLLKGIDPIFPLNILHIVGQKMQPEDIQPLMSFLSQNSSTLCELLIDDTNLSSTLKFCEFYQPIFNFNIPIIGRPEIDLKRLFGESNYMDLNRFREQIVKMPAAASKSARSYYFSRNGPKKTFDAEQYNTFVQRFPICFFDPDDIDQFQLQFKPQKLGLPSLIYLIKAQKDIRSLSDLHATCLAEPTKLPLYTIPPKSSNGTSIDFGFNDYDVSNNYKAMNQLSAFTGQSTSYSNGNDVQPSQPLQTDYNNQIQQSQQTQETEQIPQTDEFQQNINYDEQFTPDPNFLNQNYDQQFIPDPDFLNQGFNQFNPDPSFMQNNQDTQFQPFEPQPFEHLQPLEPQLQQLEPLKSQASSESDFNNNFMPAPDFDNQFMANPEFLPQDQFHFDQQLSQDNITNNQFSPYDPNQEFNPQFIPDPNVNLMINSTNINQNYSENERNIDFSSPPLQDSNNGQMPIQFQQDQNTFMPPPTFGTDQITDTPPPFQDSEQNFFIPPPPFGMDQSNENEIPPPQFSNLEPLQQQQDAFIPPPPPTYGTDQMSDIQPLPQVEPLQQQNVFIAPPPSFGSDQLNENQVPPPPLHEPEPLQQQPNVFIPPPTFIPPPPQTTDQNQQNVLSQQPEPQPQTQTEQISIIPPPLQQQEQQQTEHINIVPSPFQQQTEQLSAIPPPLHSGQQLSPIPPQLTPTSSGNQLRSSLTAFQPSQNGQLMQPPLIPSSIQANQTQQLRSSLTPPPLQGINLMPQQPKGFIPPPIHQPSAQTGIPAPIPPPLSTLSQLEQEQKEREQQQKLEQEQREREQREREQREKEQQQQLEQEQREKEQQQQQQLEQEQREREQREREQQQKLEKEQKDHEDEIEPQKQFAKTQFVHKNRGWSYAPNQPRRGPPVMVEKLTLASKKKSKKNRFSSCAGLLDLPRSPLISRKEITPAPKTVNIPNDGQVSILNPTEITNNLVPQDLHSFKDIDIPDLITFKSVSSQEKKREFTVFDHSYENAINAFYDGHDELPFQLLKVTPGSKITSSEMSHPLQKRKRIEFPQVKILGVPTEW